jgi:hypothetical protein
LPKPMNRQHSADCLSCSLACFLRCMLYGLFERHRAAFLPRAVKGRVIVQHPAGRGHAPVVDMPIIWLQG